ncbi:MAG: tRNA preQ1(34) S-adenosylmethionine ribosyltransferase-isomerase QueA [Polyangiales bacterium]
MRTDDLDYELPEDLIAAEPPPERDGARMLVLRRGASALEHRAVLDLPTLLPPRALLVVNDTRVIPARLRATKPTGGKVEVLLVRARRRRAAVDGPRPRLEAAPRRDRGRGRGGALRTRRRARRRRRAGGRLLGDDPWSLIDAHGEVPLLPYMRRRPTDDDRARYQTVFADRPGAVAAPTAGLHLSERLLAALDAAGFERARVTLHVGPGTFAPVTVDDLDAHPMHAEWYEVPPAAREAVAAAKREGRAVVAVGTTSVRALESWAATGEAIGDTRLLIQPGYSFKVVDALLTNLHLPRSTLLALVMALAGVELTRRAYAEAVAERYRFFSYGDATLVL